MLSCVILNLLTLCLPINSIDDLHKLLDEKSIGQAVQLEVLRGGKKEKIRVIPAELK